MSFKIINYCLFLSHKENYLTCYYVNSTFKWENQCRVFFNLLCTMISKPRLIILWYPAIIVMNDWSCSNTLQSSWWSCSDSLQSSRWTADHDPIPPNHRELLIILWYPQIIVVNGWSCSDTLQSSCWTTDHAPILANHRDERLIMLRYHPIIVMNGRSCSNTLQSSLWVESIGV